MKCRCSFCVNYFQIYHLIKLWQPSGERFNEPLSRCVKLRVAHAPGMPETFSPPPRVSNTDMHQGMCVTHVPWCMPGSLTSGFLWNPWLGICSRRMRKPRFYVSGKRPMDQWSENTLLIWSYQLHIRGHGTTTGKLKGNLVLMATCSYLALTVCSHSYLLHMDSCDISF